MLLKAMDVTVGGKTNLSQDISVVVAIKQALKNTIIVEIVVQKWMKAREKNDF